VYGIVEFVLACGIPILFQPEEEILAWQWRPIALLFTVYALFGLVLGGAGGVLLAWTGRHKDSGGKTAHQITAALTLVVAFVANLILAWPLQASEYVALAIAVVLAASFVAAIASHVWLERMAFLANPWAVSLLLLTIPWVSRVALTFHSTALKTGVSLLLLGVILRLAALWPSLRSGQMGTLRRRAVVAGTAALLLLSGVMLSRRPWTVRANQTTRPVQSGKPNVILITMDTVRADHLSVYGYERDTTPHLRHFAREATVYTRAIATSDLTLTTHASIFTGLYPAWHGAYHQLPNYPNGRPLGARYTTLAQVLLSDRYWTAAEVANYAMLASTMGMAKGFATYGSHRALRLSQLPWESARPFYLREGAKRVLTLAVDTSAFDERVLRAADINRHAFALLDRASHGSQPFFLFLNYMDAHVPYAPPAPFNNAFAGRDPHFRATDMLGLTVAVESGKAHVSSPEKAHLTSQYDGTIAYEDKEIGSLVTRLRELGLYENTLIIITGDHGEAFGEHDLIQHAVGSVYQDLVHVPLLVKYPGQRQGHQSDALVSQVDLMPTVLDVVGCPVPPEVQGRTLRSPRNQDSDVVYSQAVAPPSLFGLNARFRGVRRGIFSGLWKLVTWTEGPPELYDLAADPEETRNLYRTDDPRAKALADRVSAWVAAAPRQVVEPPHQLDKNSVEKLKSLGYAQ
jgi:arylsulfatase A-like enzyme